MTIARWATHDVPAASRLDFWSSALSSAMIPLYVREADPANFESEMRAADLGPITVVRQSGAAHECGRGRSELARSAVRSFNLLLSLNCAYGLTHRGELRLAPGDLTLVDSEYPCNITLRQWYEFINLAIPVEWLRTWVFNPNWLVGRRIPGDSTWGRALSTYVTQLSPDMAIQAPLAPALIADQVGALLALTAHELSGQARPARPAERSVRDRIADCVAQRCQEPALSAQDVAQSIGVSVRTLHRALASCQETFGARLLDERVKCAVRMLESPIFARLTAAEIGRRAGFADPSHFARVVRSRTGRTPQELRNGRDLDSAPADTGPAASNTDSPRS